MGTILQIIGAAAIGTVLGLAARWAGLRDNYASAFMLVVFVGLLIVVNQ